MEKSSHASTLGSSQRSGSPMVIDTTLAQNAYASQLHRKSLNQTQQQQQLRRRSVYSSEPIMSPEELTSKIADNFQQFSTMLNDLQKPTPQSPARSRPTTPILNKLSRPNSIDNKYTRRLSLNNNNNNKNTTLLLSPVSMVSPPPPQPPTIPITIPITMATQDRPRPLVAKFLRAASNGDTNLVETLLQQCGDLVNDMDADNGTTALIYAACFGHSLTVQSLLDAGAPIDEQDYYGWTALMWAAVNRHDSVVALLLSQGAVQDARSMYGTMAFDLVPDNQSMTTTLLNATTSRRHHSTMDRMAKRKKNKQLLKASRRQSTPIINATTTTTNNHQCSSPTNSFHHSGSMDAYTHFMTTESEQHRRLTQRHELFYDALLGLRNGGASLDDMDADDDGDMNDNNDYMQILAANDKIINRPFSWDSCHVDQMFVFSMDDLDTILEVTLDTKSIPRYDNNNNNNKDDSMWLPANVLFLCAKFAYYYSDRLTLTHFLDMTINRMTKTSKQCVKDTSLLQYWIANIYQFLVYLRRDTGLERNTVQQQRQLADLMIELYIMLIRGFERQLDKMISSRLLDYESIQDKAPVDFEDSNDWSTFFQRRGSLRVSMDSLSGGGDGDTNDDGPHALTAAIGKISNVMTTVYEFPEYMVKHMVGQCLHYVLCEGFNQILESRTYLCRSKAQHIRFNLSVLEEWTRQMALLNKNTYCMTGLDRLAQLLQLLQCLSELDDVDAFDGICCGLNHLDAVNIKQCVVKYRYETRETHLPTSVLEWAVQQAQQQQQQQKQPSTLDRNIYIHQLKDILLGDSNKGNLDNKKQDMVDGSCLNSLLVDSRWILPFDQDINSGTSSLVLPTNQVDNAWIQADALSEPMYLDIKQKAERDKKQSIRIPSIPYKFIDRLDKKLNK